MEAIILAAGEGSRMGNLTEALPKLFLEVDGKTIYEHQLDRLSPHCDRITIVLGHGFDDNTAPESVFDVDGLGPDTELEFLVVEEWADVENGYTALSALEKAEDDVLLVCGDVIFTQSVIDGIVDTYEHDLRAEGLSGVGVIEGIQDEMTAVRWDSDGIITDYGAIEGHQEIGLFVLNAAHLDRAREVLSSNHDDWFPVIFENVPSKPIQVEETERHEINTPAHLRAAREKWGEQVEQSVPER